MFSAGNDDYWHAYPTSVVGATLAAVGVYLGRREFRWMWQFYLLTEPVVAGVQPVRGA
jgi:hypothetical protein